MSGFLRLSPHRKATEHRTKQSSNTNPNRFANKGRKHTTPNYHVYIKVLPSSRWPRTILRTMNLALTIGNSRFGASISIDSALSNRSGRIGNSRFGASISIDSACRTSLGEEVPGEGLVGMTRGFMYAGSSRVIAGLWDADDLVTTELVRNFHEAMEQDKMAPAAALRYAKIQVWKRSRWS